MSSILPVPSASLGEAMRARMQELQMSQPQLAQRLGFSQSFISRLLRGKAVLDVNSVRSVERALGWPHGWIALLLGLVPPDGRGVVRSISESDLNEDDRRVLTYLYVLMRRGRIPPPEG